MAFVLDGAQKLGAYRDHSYPVRLSTCHCLTGPCSLFMAHQGSRVEQEEVLRHSTTLYVGNLSFYTTEEQIHALFGMCGDVKKVIMGLDKAKRTPCGFCFVE